jgi:hypothetical protein
MKELEEKELEEEDPREDLREDLQENPQYPFNRRRRW